MNLDKIFNSSDVVISDDVIASIALNAAKDVEGFGSLSVRTPDFFNRLLPPSVSSEKKSVKVHTADGGLQIEMYVNLLGSADVRSVSQEIQSAVKNSVQSMTGKVVSRVDIFIEGIDFCEPNELNENS